MYSIIGLVGCIVGLVVEKTKYNKAYVDNATDVLPHQLVLVLPRKFPLFVQHHWDCLEYTFSIKDIEMIDLQHKVLCELYRH